MTTFNKETKAFIHEYAKSITLEEASVFIGAGLSKAAGYLGWADLLKDKAEEIGLNIKKEKDDLIELAQFYINAKHRTAINDAIRTCFAPSGDIKPTENHLLLSALPIKSYWTTNYDRLLEQTFDLRGISYRTQYSDKNLSLSSNNAQVVIHKMHGDVEVPSSAVIAKEDYEIYDDTHEMMLAKFKGEICSKSFLFLGYSFNDPNIDHIFGRIRKVFDKNAKQHYCIMTRIPKEVNGEAAEDYDYKIIKQKHRILDFKNYGINVILVDNREDITLILSEIRRLVYMKNILISGSYEDETLNKDEIIKITTFLTTWLVEKGFHIFSGFGKNLGGLVVKGAFDGCTLGTGKEFNKYASLFPFPYNVEFSEEEKIKLYTRLRENMIVNTHITIIICGEKKDKNGNLIPSLGAIEEFKISQKQGNLIIPIAVSGGAAAAIWHKIDAIKNNGNEDTDFNILNSSWKNYDEILTTIQKIILDYCS